MRLRPVPLRAEEYAPYGRVLAASPDGRGGSPANLGTATKFADLARMENARGDAAPLRLSVYRCRPAEVFPFEVAMLERHPFSTQLFVPMNALRYLVVVAGGAERPDLRTLRAFVAGGAQAITYLPGTWHHPMIALDRETDFVCLVHEDGGPGDCHEHRIDGERPWIERPDGPSPPALL